MLKWIYRIMAIAVALCFIGGILIGVGYAAGGVRYLSQRDEGGRLRGEGKVYTETKEVPAFDKIQIDLETSDLEILPSEDDKFRVSYRVYGKKEENPLTWTNKDGLLTITENSPVMHINFSIQDIFFFAGGSEYKKISQKEGVFLYIPAGASVKTTEITSDAGDMVIKKLNTGDLSIEISAGDMAMDHVKAEKADIDMKGGDLTGKSLSLKQLSFTGGSGDVHLNSSILSNSSINMHSGDLGMRSCTFIGKNDIDLTHGDCQIENTSPAVTDMNWNLQTSFGDIVVPDEMLQKAGSQNRDKDEMTAFTLNQDPKQPSVNLNCKNGDITVR